MRRTTIATLLISLTAATALPAMSAEELRAIAEDGRKVILSPDGKWKFDNRLPTAPSSTSDAASPYQTAVKRFSLNFDTSKWILIPKQDTDEYNKRMFRHKSLPIMAMVIADEIPASKETVRDIIISNANSAATSMTILQEQDKEVGGKTIGAIKFAATLKTLEFVFSNHYYGAEDGNIQVMCYSVQSLFHKYERDCQQFTAGLTIK